MNYVGIDLGLGSTGWGVVDEDRALVASGAIKGRLFIGPHPGRLEFIAETLDRILDTTPSIAGVAIENYSMGNRAQYGQYAKAELGGVARLLVYRKYFQIILIPPKSLLKFTTGSGNTKSKNPTKEFVARNFDGHRSRTSDESDAIGLADMCRMCLCIAARGQMNVAQQEAMKGVELVEAKPRPRIRTRSVHPGA